MSEPYSRQAIKWKTAHGDPRFRSITITSNAGVGGSTAFSLLRKRLEGSGDWGFISVGEVMRGYAAQNGMTMEDFVVHMESHPEKDFDKLCDKLVAKMGQGGQIVAEGRLTHAFVPPPALNVLLVCDLNTRATRRHRDKPGLGLEQVHKRIVDRDEGDEKRYALRYPGCLWMPNDFDLVISTAVTSPEMVVEQIIARYSQKPERRRRNHQMIVAPRVSQRPPICI